MKKSAFFALIGMLALGACNQPGRDLKAPQVSLVLTPKTLQRAGEVLIHADATDNKGVAKVEFYDGDQLIDTDETAPYELTKTYNAADNGKHTIKAVAIDTSGNKATVQDVLTINIPTEPPPPPPPVKDTTNPTVKLTVTPGEVTKAGEVKFAAEAADDKGIAKVEFYDGDQLIDTDETAPYELVKSYTEADNGKHTIKAIAIDTSGNKAESEIAVTVNIPTAPKPPSPPKPPVPPQPPVPPAKDTTNPTVKLTVTPGEVTKAGEVKFAAEAADDKGVAKVEFYDGDKLIGTDETAPYELVKSYTEADNGKHTIKAIAIDTSGNKATVQDVLTINIPTEPPPPPPPAKDTTNPTVKLTVTPGEVTKAGEVKFAAEAADDKGVAKVEFYDGDKLIGTDETAPYELVKSYTEADNGEHTIKAVAIDTSENKAEASEKLLVKIETFKGDATLSIDVIRANRSDAVVGSTATLFKTGDRQKALATATTDANGYAEFAGIAAGTYDIVLSKTNSAGSELIGAPAQSGINTRLKVAQFDAVNPTASTRVPSVKLLAADQMSETGEVATWKDLTAGTVMTDKVNLRAYTTADNPAPLQMRYFLFSLMTFDAGGLMNELRTGLAPIDAGKVIPGEHSQDSGLISLDNAGLSGAVYAQVAALDFNKNRVAYLVPIQLERTATPVQATAPVSVKAVSYTNNEQISYIYSTEDPSAAPKNSNMWVSVTWKMPADTTGVTGYRVLRATQATGPYTQVAFAGNEQCKADPKDATIKNCTASDNTASLQVNQDYYYKVVALGTNEAVSAEPTLPSTHTLPPFAPQLLSPGPEAADVELLPMYTFKTNAFEGGATGLRFDLRVSDAFTSAGNMDAPPLRLIAQNGSFNVTGVGTDERDYGKWVGYDPASDTLKVPHDLGRVRSGLSAIPLQANRRYSWLLHRAYAYRLQDPTQPESESNPVVAYSVYSDPETTKIVPGGTTQSVSTVHHFVTKP